MLEIQLNNETTRHEQDGSERGQGLGSAPRRYGIAVIAVVLALVGREALTVVWGPTAVPFIWFFLAVNVSAWQGGLGPGLLAIALSALAAAFFFMEPRHSLNIGAADLMALGVFILASLIMVVTSAAMHRANARLRIALSDRSRAQQDHRHAQALTTERNAHIEAIFNAMTDGAVVFGADGRISLVNQAVIRLTGYARAEEMQHELSHFTEVWELATPEGAVLPVEQWPASRVLRGEPLKDVELRARRRDTGQEWLFSVSGEPVRDADHRQILAVIITRDITEQKRAEKALRESETRFKRLAEVMPQLVWMAADDGTVTYYNSRSGQYAGISKTQQGWDWAPAVHPDDVAETLAKWRSAVAGGEQYQCAHRIRMADGCYRWHLSRAERVDEGSGSPQWFGTATDIDEVKQAQEVLKQADRIKNEFIATLAHELRNPLAAADMAVQLLRTSGNLDERANSAAGILERQVRQMSRLMDDLLDVNRIAAGKLDFRMEPFDLADLVAEVAENWRATGRFNRHRVVLNAAPATVRADRMRIQQVLSNLLENALKFSSEGSEVRMEVVRAAASAILTVTDSGRGFSLEEARRLFEPFQQSRNEDRSAGGLGLGLAIVKHLVEAHGGSVRAFSEGPGCGASFTVELPCQQ